MKVGRKATKNSKGLLTMYELTHAQVYQRYHDTDNDVAKLYWLTKLIDRANCGSKQAASYVRMIEACSK